MMNEITPIPKSERFLLKRCICILLAALVSWVLLEVTARFYVERFRNRSIVIDNKLGWRSRPNHTFTGRYPDRSGQMYDVHVRTDVNGFRTFGDPASVRPKVLLVGDSFTHAVEVSNDKTFHNQIASFVDVEVFAYGALGYGTLQKLMILDEWMDRIRPDIVIIQFCPNDFINNSAHLEKKSYSNRNGMRRPYMAEDGSIVYAMPASLPWLRHFANKYSRALYFMLSRLDMRAAARRQGESIEHVIREKGMSHPEFKEAVAVTEHLFRMIVQRAGRATVLAFDESDAEPYHTLFCQILERNGIREIAGLPQALRQAETRGQVVRAKDGSRWNDAGHHVVAQVLASHLAEIDVERTSRIMDRREAKDLRSRTTDSLFN